MSFDKEPKEEENLLTQAASSPRPKWKTHAKRYSLNQSYEVLSDDENEHGVSSSAGINVAKQQKDPFADSFRSPDLSAKTAVADGGNISELRAPGSPGKRVVSKSSGLAKFGLLQKPTENVIPEYQPESGRKPRDSLRPVDNRRNSRRLSSLSKGIRLDFSAVSAPDTGNPVTEESDNTDSKSASANQSQKDEEFMFRLAAKQREVLDLKEKLAVAERELAELEKSCPQQIHLPSSEKGARNCSKSSKAYKRTAYHMSSIFPGLDSGNSKEKGFGLIKNGNISIAKSPGAKYSIFKDTERGTIRKSPSLSSILSKSPAGKLNTNHLLRSDSPNTKKIGEFLLERGRKVVNDFSENLKTFTDDIKAGLNDINAEFQSDKQPRRSSMSPNKSTTNTRKRLSKQFKVPEEKKQHYKLADYDDVDSLTSVEWNIMDAMETYDKSVPLTT